MSAVLHAKVRHHRQRTTTPWRTVLAVALAIGTLSVASPAQAVTCPHTDSVLAGNQVLVFDSLGACEWTPPPGVTAADVLVVAGGGAGAVSTSSGPGAGGGGGLIYRAVGSGGQVALSPGVAVQVEVGARGALQNGAVAGNNGARSAFGSLIAFGGGGGGVSTDGAGRSGGSGGGASQIGNEPGVASPSDQGHSGGSAFSTSLGGGGGGAGSVADGAIGGDGKSLSISGQTVFYSGGGGAATSLGCASLTCNIRRSKADIGTAGGPTPYGHGGYSGGVNSGNGWQGIVIVRYPVPAPAPGTPGTPTATAGNAEATVEFTPPVGGSTPTSYIARVAAPGDTSKTCTLTLFTPSRTTRIKTGLTAAIAPTLSCTVTGLTNGTAYTFETKASNGADSGWSAPSNSVTPTGPPVPPAPSAPSAPTSVTAVAGTASVAASWTPVDGATGYTATAQPGPSTCSTTAATTCVLGAVAGTTYTITVVAHSGTGNSAASAPSNAVTPVQPVVPPEAPDDAPITLTTDKGQIALAVPGQDIIVIGTGFAAFSTATVILYSTPIALGSTTTDATGGFAIPVTIPPDLAAGEHTFLASGVNPAGGPRTMALPVTVAPTDSGSTGGGTGTGTLPVPSGGSITLLDAAGQPATTVVVPEGTYALDAITGIITFVPVAGFVGTATSVAYRITDAIGTVVNGTYTAVITAPAPPSPPAGKPTVKLPVRIVSSTGKSSTAQASCRITRGSIARCTITVTAVVSKRTVVVGKGSITTKKSQSLKQVTVKAALNALGRSLAARPGGARFTFTGVVTQRGRTGSTTARGVTTVLAKTIVLPRPIHFTTDSAKIGTAETKYLKGVRTKLAGVKGITCVGHADSRGSAKDALKLGARRAKAACAVLAKGRKVTVHIISKGEKAPTGKNNTEAGRAHNRRVDITLHN